MTATRGLIAEMLAERLSEAARDWYRAAREELAGGTDSARFAALISLASRHAPRADLAPSDAQRAAARELLEGWDPRRWTCLDGLRVGLVLSRGDLSEPSAEAALEDAFRYADEGELRALYRCLAHLPAPERFSWRAREGCRTNIVPVFEAVACDTPYPSRYFDDIAWNQLIIKAVFIGASLWRVFGLDGRLSEELARMALDLADERRSAGRVVQPELWLCLGSHGGERALASLQHELDNGPALGRRAAALALARRGERDKLQAALDAETDGDVAATMRLALDGHCDQTAFAVLEPKD